MHLNEQQAAKERPINMLLHARASTADKREIISKAILPPCVRGRTPCMHLNSHQWDHLHSASHHHFQLFQLSHLIYACNHCFLCFILLSQEILLYQGTSYWGYFRNLFPTSISRLIRRRNYWLSGSFFTLSLLPDRKPAGCGVECRPIWASAPILSSASSSSSYYHIIIIIIIIFLLSVLI